MLEAAGERPEQSARQSEKNQYAIRFADAMGQALAEDLRALHKDLAATSASARRATQADRKAKQLDVACSTVGAGLQLGISLKSVHIREPGGRYTHNMKRNEEELRIEAMGYHKRQPFAIMIAVLFLPFDACTDARTPRTPSSFGSWVRHLRHFAGRVDERDDIDLFERIYVALYEPDGSALGFFDVAIAPPRNGRPRTQGDALAPDGTPARLLQYDEFLAATLAELRRRNGMTFEWADGEPDPLPLDDLEAPSSPDGEAEAN